MSQENDKTTGPSPNPEQMRKDYQKITGMQVVQQPQPSQGKTEFAKDKPKEK